MVNKRKLIKCLKYARLNLPVKKNKKKVKNFLKLSCKNGSMLLTLFLKCSFSISHLLELPKNIELNIYMKDHWPMKLVKLSLLVILTDHYVCLSLRWFQPQITLDSMLSVEYSPVPLLLVIKSESKVVNTNLEVNMICIENQSKELFSWWVEVLSLLLMSMW